MAVTQLVNKFPPFHEAWRFICDSEELATCPHPQPVKFSLNPLVLCISHSIQCDRPIYTNHRSRTGFPANTMYLLLITYIHAAGCTYPTLYDVTIIIRIFKLRNCERKQEVSTQPGPLTIIKWKHFSIWQKIQFMQLLTWSFLHTKILILVMEVPCFLEVCNSFLILYGWALSLKWSHFLSLCQIILTVQWQSQQTHW